MKESSTYQAIVAEGRAEGFAEGLAKGARHVLLLFGRERFGPPDAATRTALKSITDVDHLNDLAKNVSKVNSWQELLASVPRQRRNGRRKTRR